MIPILVFTSDKYLKALQPFAWLFNRYWSAAQAVDVIGFAQPDFMLPSNFSFHSIGDMKDYPFSKWSNQVIDYLEIRQDISHAIILLEDYWLIRPVNLSAIRMLYDYMLQFRNVLKMDLCADRLYAAGMTDYDNCDYLDLVLSDYRSQYQMSAMAGIWSKELLLRFMQRNESPHEFELNGTPRVAAAHDEVIVLGTRQWVVRHTLGHRGGDSGKLYLDELKPVDRLELERLGYLPY